MKLIVAVLAKIEKTKWRGLIICVLTHTPSTRSLSPFLVSAIAAVLLAM